MAESPDIFCEIALEEFSYLVSEFHFTANIIESSPTISSVCFDSPKVSIVPGWDFRDGTDVGIWAKEDTFWIRPASSHRYSVLELMQMLAPGTLEEMPKTNSIWTEKTEATLRPVLGFYAKQLRTLGESLLRGSLSLCEDMLITRYCNSSKGLPIDEYFRIFREECRVLSQEDREAIEQVLLTRSARPVYFLLDKFVHSRKLLSRRFLETLNNFWLQYFH